MSTKNFLDKTGVAYYLTKIKSFLSSTYVAKDGDKVLSTNDYTNAEKTKLEGITAGATKTEIDDTTTSAEKVWSSSKINTQISGKQDALTPGSRISIDSSTNTISADSEIDDTANTSTNTWSASKINAVISALNKLSLAIVQTLPTQDISNTTIYLVPKTTSQTNNIYDEWVYVNNSWEKIGSTEIDLSGYVQESDLVAITNAEIDNMFV